MTDGYWNRQQTLLSQSGMLKRPHSDYGSFPLSLSLSRFPARSLCFVQFALFLYSCLCKFVNFDFFFIDSLLLVLAIWLDAKRRHFEWCCCRLRVPGFLGSYICWVFVKWVCYDHGVPVIDQFLFCRNFTRFCWCRKTRVFWTLCIA